MEQHPHAPCRKPCRRTAGDGNSHQRQPGGDQASRLSHFEPIFSTTLRPLVQIALRGAAGKGPGKMPARWSGLGVGAMSRRAPRVTIGLSSPPGGLGTGAANPHLSGAVRAHWTNGQSGQVTYQTPPSR